MQCFFTQGQGGMSSFLTLMNKNYHLKTDFSVHSANLYNIKNYYDDLKPLGVTYAKS